VGSQAPSIYRFGLFEVDSRSGEVRKSGVRIKLQDQPFQVLLKLLEQPGSIVSREDLHVALWQGDTFVDFDAGLNTVMRRLRDGLGDLAENPTLIETVPRRGYRFIAPVEKIEAPVETGIPGAPAIHSSPVTVPPLGHSSRQEPGDSSAGRNRPAFLLRGRVWLLLAVFGAVLLILVVLVSVQTSPVSDSPLRFKQITHDGVAKSGPLLSDGTRIYFSELTPSGRALVQVAATGGEVIPLPTVLQNPRLCSMSPEGNEMLTLAGKGEPPLPLWMLPVAGDSPRRIGAILASDAAWCPDPELLVYSAGHDIFVVRKDGTRPQKLLTAEGFPTGLCWSPDGQRLRFHTWDPAPSSLTLWELRKDGTDLRPLLPSSSALKFSSGGVWNGATGAFFFQAQAGSEDRTDVWSIPPIGRRVLWTSATPVRLTSGPLSFSSPAVNSDNPKELFVLGTAPRAELVRLDSSSGRFLPYLGGISAEGVDFSRDGRWIAYIAYPGGDLWRCRVDGTERRRLTFPPVRAFLPRWSPDGRSIAFVDVSKRTWTIQLISSEGTGLKQLSPAGQSASDPTWSPDGDRLAFGGVDLTHADNPSEFFIQVLHLASGQVTRVTTLPGSNGLFSPRWSPSGRHMAAINAASELTVLNLSNGRDTFTLTGYKAGFPSWSRDGDFIYFQDRTNPEVPSQILRLFLPSREVETVIELEGIGRLPLGTFASWSGLTPDDAPLLCRDISVQEVYSVRW